MTTYTMTVHEALSELKVLNQRIEKEMRRTKLVTTNKHANTKIEGIDIKTYKESMKSSLQKIQDLIARRNAIKRAVTKSNANTNITLTKSNGKSITMTVAEAIEYKAVGINYITQLNNLAASQLNEATQIIKQNNMYIEERADKYVTDLYGKDSSNNDNAETARKAYIEASSFDLIDPNNIEELISSLEDEINFYKTKVDAALSTSNAITTIEFEV